MSIAASTGARGASDPDAERGRLLAAWSLLMLPILILSAVAAAFLGMFLLGRRDLQGSEPMSVQGAYGWMVWALTTVVFVAPAAVGVVMGFRARAHGARRPGTLGIVLNGLILVGFPLLSLVNLLGE
jgi:hypothetical protein